LLKINNKKIQLKPRHQLTVCRIQNQKNRHQRHRISKIVVSLLFLIFWLRTGTILVKIKKEALFLQRSTPCCTDNINVVLTPNRKIQIKGSFFFQKISKLHV
jgi:hypothetical protein